MKHTTQGFVSPPDGTLKWKPGPNDTTEYVITVKQGANETVLPPVRIAGKCSIENIEVVINDRQAAIQAIIGERVRNLRDDIIRMAKTQ